MTEQRSVQLIRALASIWGAIRDHHPDVPEVILLPAPSLTRKLNVLGHFAPLRWRTRDAGDGLLHEVVVVAEHLDRSAEDILETLLHEAAHAMNFARGIKDCSSTSQYHNRRFRDAAEELGLSVTQVANYGFALTRLEKSTIARYAHQADHLAKVLVHRRKPAHRAAVVGPTGEGREGPPSLPRIGGDVRRSRNLRATCACGFIIRASRKTYTSTGILCLTCGEVFRPNQN